MMEIAGNTDARDEVMKTKKEEGNMKRYTMMAIALVAGVMCQLDAAEPIARVMSEVATFAPGATSSTKEVWLNTGSDSQVITQTGKGQTGAGIIRALSYSAVGGVTNGAISFCT